jgi:hypothetical protein
MLFWKKTRREARKRQTELKLKFGFLKQKHTRTHTELKSELNSFSKEVHLRSKKNKKQQTYVEGLFLISCGDDAE